MIIIYSKERDEFVNKVIDWLPKDSFFRISLGNGFECELKVLEDEFYFNLKNYFKAWNNLNNISGIWHNGGFPKKLSNKTSEELANYQSLEFKDIIEGIVTSFNPKQIGSWESNLPNNKIKTLLKAKKSGLKIPSSLLTSKKSELLDFFNAHNHSLISKKIVEPTIFQEQEFLFDISKSFEINMQNIKEIPNTFGLSLFQERIEKKFEIRAFYFNGFFNCCAIFDDSHNIDVRNSLNSNDKPRMIPFTLPEKIKAKLDTLMKLTNNPVGSIDLIYNKNDEIIFLEVNPVGQIDFINNACNFYLDKLFADHLLN